MTQDTEGPGSRPLEEERRNLLRIEDTAIIELRALPNVVPIQETQRSQPTPADIASQESFAEDDDKLFFLMRELQSIDIETGQSFNALRAQAPEMAACLEAMNRKINSIGEALCNDIFETDKELQAIDLSAGGIGFVNPARLAEGSFHRLKLWFNRSCVGVCATIKVLACNRAINGGFHISASFSSISQTDLHIICRHISQVEAQMRREAAELQSAIDHHGLTNQDGANQDGSEADSE